MRSHASIRAEERLGFRLSREALRRMEKLIHQGKSVPQRGGQGACTVHLLYFNGKYVRAVYNTRRGEIVTIHPPKTFDMVDETKFRELYKQRYGHYPEDGIKPWNGVEKFFPDSPLHGRRREVKPYEPSMSGRDPSGPQELSDEPPPSVDDGGQVVDNERGTPEPKGSGELQIKENTMQPASTVPSMFQAAQKAKVFLRMAITGPSGSGKTFTSLYIARGLAGPKGRIAVVDTENGTAALYADRVKFFHCLIKQPYEIGKILAAFKAAFAEGFDVVVADSISHFWVGEGGLLDQKTALDSRPGANHFTNWGPITKEHEAFKAMILNSPTHMICTMRSKQAHELTTDANGKKKVEKLGLKPEQREGMEYEFDVVGDMGMDHSMIVTKDRTALFNDRPFKPGEETGKKLIKWLNDGAEVVNVPVVSEAAGAAEKPSAVNTAPSMEVNNGTGGGDPTEAQWAELKTLSASTKISPTSLSKEVGITLPWTAPSMAQLLDAMKKKAGVTA